MRAKSLAEMFRVCTLAAVVVLVCLGLPVGSNATDDIHDDPLKVVQTNVDEVISILSQPLEPGQEEKRRAELRALIRDMFDFNEISKRVLGRHWRKFSKAEFKEFQELFAKMLENVYLTKIESYSGERVIYESVRKIGKNKYAVNTKIIQDNLEIPVVYRLKKIDGRWVGYDVIVEGISLVKNYRSQFQQILKKKSPEDLLAYMREKVQTMEAKQTESSKG